MFFGWSSSIVPQKKMQDTDASLSIAKFGNKLYNISICSKQAIEVDIAQKTS